MAKGYNLGDLRGAIEDINREVMAERGNGEALNSDVISRLKSQRSKLVNIFAPQLIDIALTKLLNEVCRRNAASNGAQSYLFEDYSKIPEKVTIEKGIKKQTSMLTLAEAEEWILNHSKRTVKSDNEDFQRLIDDCREHSKSMEETIEEILNRKRAGVATQKALDLVI